jgi:hypothetical protein
VTVSRRVGSLDLSIVSRVTRAEADSADTVIRLKPRNRRIITRGQGYLGAALFNVLNALP